MALQLLAAEQHEFAESLIASEQPHGELLVLCSSRDQVCPDTVCGTSAKVKHDRQQAVPNSRILVRAWKENYL